MLINVNSPALKSSSVQRKFEELRQSVQIQNSIDAVRKSTTTLQQSPKQSQYYDHGIEDIENGDKEAHCNSIVLETVMTQPAAQAVRRSEQEFPLKGEDNGPTKEMEAKASVMIKDEHKITLQELCERYSTSIEKGMDSDKALDKQKRDGLNMLSEREKVSLWVKLFHELTNGFALMLWVSSGLCFFAYGITPDDISNLYLAVVLVIVIGVTGLITFQQNAKSEALMESFKSFLPQKCLAVRDGQILSIEAINLVVGDVVMVKAGEKIPADIRIIESNEMKVDNSPLTGESEPLLRTVECSHPENYLETANVAFFGTLCKEGSGKGIVIFIGDRTTLGQIADLSHGEGEVLTPLRIELNRFVYFITAVSVVLGGLFFLLALFVMKMPITSCIAFGIGILVANVPEGMLGCITICLAITAKTLSEKFVLVKNLEAVETLGSTSCICTDKTGTLTQNVMSLYHMWYGGKVIFARNKKLLEDGETPAYDENDLNFRALQQAALICSDAIFDTQSLKDQSNVDYLTCPVLGDATETGLIRFYQFIEDIVDFRKRFQLVKNSDGSSSKMLFNSQVKFALTVVKEETENSHFTVYVKGAPEKIWGFSSSVVNGQQLKQIDAGTQQQFKDVNLRLGKGGERVLGFARLRLPASQFPIDSQFIVSTVQKFLFKLENFEFVGLISLMDPPKTRVPKAILECRSAGIKVIMVTGDQPPTAAAIARQVNIIPKRVQTNEDLMEQDPSLSWFDASQKCSAIVVHGDRIVESFEKSTSENRDDQYFYLRQWVKKDFCVFARTTPAQKLQIVQACQNVGYVVAATGDGVNDSPAIKQADIGISMNISGSDVTKDAADMILLDDDFASIVTGISEGRKIFDNLKKTIVYLLTSNMTEIIPFIAFVLIKLPIPLSSIYMLVLQVGTDVWPAISLAYEEAELDIMTRKPRQKAEHLVSTKIIAIGYMQMGFMASSAGFIGYFVAFNRFGFAAKELIGLAVFSAYKTPENNFQTVLNPVTGNQEFYYNALLSVGHPDCTQQSAKDNAASLYREYDWLSINDSKYDLRKAFLICDPTTKQYVPTIEWTICDVDSSYTYSKVVGSTACYNTDAIKWAQTCYFVGVVFTQWSNIFSCKSRKMSFTTSAVNRVMLNGIVFETLLTIFLLYVPGVQNIFGGRPLEFFLFGVPSFCFSILLLTWDEVRKHLTRTNRFFLKYTLW